MFGFCVLYICIASPAVVWLFDAIKAAVTAVATLRRLPCGPSHPPSRLETVWQQTQRTHTLSASCLPAIRSADRTVKYRADRICSSTFCSFSLSCRIYCAFQRVLAYLCCYCAHSEVSSNITLLVAQDWRLFIIHVGVRKPTRSRCAIKVSICVSIWYL